MMTQKETEVFHKLRVATPLSSRSGNPVSVVFNGVSANSWLSPIGISNNRKSEDNNSDHFGLPQRPQSTGSIAIIRHHPKPSGLKWNETIVGQHLHGKGEEIDVHCNEGSHQDNDAFKRPVPFEGDYRESVDSLLYKQRLVKKGYRGGALCNGATRKSRLHTSRSHQFVENPISLEITVKSLELSRDRHSDSRRKPLSEEASGRNQHQSENVIAFKDLSKTCTRRAQSAPPASRQDPVKQKPSLYWRARSAYHRKLMTPHDDSDWDSAETSQILRGSMLRPLMYNASSDIQHSAGCPYKCKGCFKACLVSADYLENAKNRRQPMKSRHDFRYRSLMKKDPRFILHQALARNQPIYKLVHGYCDVQSVQEAWNEGATSRAHEDESVNLTQLSVVGGKAGSNTRVCIQDDMTVEDDDTYSQEHRTVEETEEENVVAQCLQPRLLKTQDSKPAYQLDASPIDETLEGKAHTTRDNRLLREEVTSVDKRRNERLVQVNSRFKSCSEAENTPGVNLFLDMDGIDQEASAVRLTTEQDTVEDRTPGDVSNGARSESETNVNSISNVEGSIPICDSRCGSISDVNSAVMDVSKLVASSLTSVSSDLDMSDCELSKRGSSIVSSEGDRDSDNGSNDSQITIRGESGNSGGYNNIDSDSITNSVETLTDVSAKSESTNRDILMDGNVRRKRNGSRNGSRSVSSACGSDWSGRSPHDERTEDSTGSPYSHAGRSSGISDVTEIQSVFTKQKQKSKPASKSRYEMADTKRKPQSRRTHTSRMHTAVDESKSHKHRVGSTRVKSDASDETSGASHSEVESGPEHEDSDGEGFNKSSSSEGETSGDEDGGTACEGDPDVTETSKPTNRWHGKKDTRQQTKQVKGKRDVCSAVSSDSESETDVSERTSREGDEDGSTACEGDPDVTETSKPTNRRHGKKDTRQQTKQVKDKRDVCSAVSSDSESETDVSERTSKEGDDEEIGGNGSCCSEDDFTNEIHSSEKSSHISEASSEENSDKSEEVEESSSLECSDGSEDRDGRTVSGDTKTDDGCASKREQGSMKQHSKKTTLRKRTDNSKKRLNTKGRKRSKENQSKETDEEEKSGDDDDDDDDDYDDDDDDDDDDEEDKSELMKETLQDNHITQTITYKDIKSKSRGNYTYYSTEEGESTEESEHNKESADDGDDSDTVNEASDSETSSKISGSESPDSESESESDD